MKTSSSDGETLVNTQVFTREGKGEDTWRVYPRKQEKSMLPSAKALAKNKSHQEGTCPEWRGTINQGNLKSKGQNQQEKS